MDSKTSTLTVPKNFWEGVSIDSKTSTLTGPIFFGKYKYMDSKNYTLTCPFFLGRSKYGFKNFHLIWPKFFGEGVSIDSKTST